MVSGEFRTKTAAGDNQPFGFCNNISSPPIHAHLQLSMTLIDRNTGELRYAIDYVCFRFAKIRISKYESIRAGIRILTLLWGRNL